MRVVLAPEVFERTSLTDLLPFLWFGATGRHRILVEDPRSQAYRLWLDGIRDERLRADWEHVTGEGLRLDAMEPSHHEIRVGVRQDSAWSRPVPLLTIPAAIDLLQRPYRILVENGISDRAFLLCVCPPRERDWIERRVHQEWVEIEHCGGIDHLKKCVEDIRKEKARSVRCSALFDSDALQPGKPSKTSRSTEEACHPEVHHHQLARRAIESYLPRAALDSWSKQVEKKQRRARETIISAFFKMSDDQRAHYNMKEGFDRDANRASESGTLFDDLDRATREKLRAGFDKDIATLYQHGHVRWEDLDRTGALDTIRTFVEEIIARIR